MFIWRLDELMEEKNYESKDVVRLTKVHKNIVSRIKNNQQRRIDLDVLEKLCRGLQVTPNDLIKYVPQEKENDKKIYDHI